MSSPMVEPFRPALAVSALVHALVFGLAMLATLHGARTTNRAESGASISGNTFDIDAVIEAQKRVAAAPPVELGAGAAAADPAAAARGRRPDPAVGEPAPASRALPKRKRSSPSEAPARPSGSGSPSGALASAPAPAASGDAPGSPSAGTSGSSPRVASLAKAFAKAVTAATHKDPTWDALPLGAAGAARVMIVIDDEGRIERSVVSERDELPAHVLRLVDRTLLLLGAGRFALSRADVTAGSETLRIEITLSSVEPQEDYEDPRHTVAMGFDPPRPSVPGRAYFIHAAGRRFDAKISIE